MFNWLSTAKSRCLATVLLSLIVGSVFAAGPTGPVPGRFVVKFKTDVKSEVVATALGTGKTIAPFSKLRLDSDLAGSELWSQVKIITDPTGTLTVSDIINSIGADKIEYVEPEYYIEFFDMPTDSLFENQWYLNNTGQSYLGVERFPGYANDLLVTKSGTPGKDMGMSAIYGSPPVETTRVVVAIVDTGVDIDHPELINNLWHNPDEIADGIDNDHNGLVDDTIGYDVSGDYITFSDPITDNNPSDGVGHGTHIAGIVAASHDGVGIAGVSSSAQIMAVKIRPNATTGVATAGILYAVNAGAQVINVSWGTPFESGILKEAFAFARRNGVFIAIAPGNTGDNQRFFPAAFDSTFVVGAGNSDGFMADFSTFGEHIDIVAPGLDILSLRAGNTDLYEDIEPGLRIIDSLYLLADGTSMAAPMVAGAAAVLLSHHPELGLEQLESLLKAGAVDIVDPWNEGDNYPGPDTITGAGYVNISNSLLLAGGSGLAIAEPIRKNRYVDDLPIKVIPVGGYNSSWRLDYSIGLGEHDWQFLASGSSVPSDSIIFILTDTTINGLLNLRLIAGSRTTVTSCTYVRTRRVEIVSPVESDDVRYTTKIRGSVFGPDYDSMSVKFQKLSGGSGSFVVSSNEFYDSLLHNWAISGVDTGDFVITLTGYFESGQLVDSVAVHVSSAFASGWPKSLGGFGGVTPVTADLDHDGINEIVVPTTVGLHLLSATGELLPGFPFLVGQDVRSVPAIYDVDRDGEDEIIFTSDSTIHVVNKDGTYADGWPVHCFTGVVPSTYGWPNPTITKLGQGEDSAVVILNTRGQVMAYEFNGDPYFYSLEGLFAQVGDGVRNENYSSQAPPFVTSADLDGDSLYEVITVHSTTHGGGLAILDGRSGQPAFGMESSLVQYTKNTSGSVLADLNQDGLHEIIMLGYQTKFDGTGEDEIPTLWVKTKGTQDFPGWPIQMEEIPQSNWIAMYPTVADLDLDGTMEILCSFFTFGKSLLYIFNSDGSSYLPSINSSAGQAYECNELMANVIVGNVTGDEFPEILFRAGHLLPGTGSEYLYILDHQANLIPGYPIVTPAVAFEVFSSRFAPLIEDIDSDGLAEIALISDDASILVWNTETAMGPDDLRGKFLMNNLNSGKYPIQTSIQTQVDDDHELLPIRFSMHQNFPNPFNPSTLIRYTIDKRTNVLLTVYNLLGQKVSTLVDDEKPIGEYEVKFNGSDLASGLYFYRLSIDGKDITRKMVLLK